MNISNPVCTREAQYQFLEEDKEMLLKLSKVLKTISNFSKGTFL
jgi:hypothetical protein